MLAQSSSSQGVDAIGVVALASFLAIVAALAFAIAKIHTIRHRMAWRPLLGVVDGRVEPGNSPNSSVMRGTWRGLPLVATALPGSGLGPGEDPARYNRVVLRLFDLSGAGDWRVTLGGQGWQVDAADRALAGRLTAAGVARMAADLGLPQDNPLPAISFDAAGRHLELNADAGRPIVPSPAQLTALLDAMMTIAGINAAVNPAPAD